MRVRRVCCGEWDRLLTNVARNMPETKACRLCGCVREDDIHILWGCRAAQVGFVVVCERMIFIFFGVVASRLCGCVREDVIHILWDCRAAQELWRRFFGRRACCAA
ncbi:hypothetical protein J1N35_013788 [Gossypium stocksii]|uniref:Uncharacterized protein n=1 Tax=Gossypium stocksii TaxID=47602 RepID=A0A9D3VTB0_9ROSI|nr:hypothetical protein J1N35_013788 [Gossypium stocksii]